MQKRIRSTLPDRHPIMAIDPRTAALPLRHSVGSHKIFFLRQLIQDISSLIVRFVTVEEPIIEGVSGDTAPGRRSKGTVPSSVERDVSVALKHSFLVRDTNWATCMHSPVSMLQIRTVSSAEADATSLESCENTTE